MKFNPANPGLSLFELQPLANYPNNIGHFLKGFGQDLSGEIYVLGSLNLGPSGSTGKVFKIVPAP